MLGDTAFDWPREGTLSLKIGRATVAGVEAKQADVNMRIDADGLEIERLAIADFGGATLAVKGRIDTRAQSPRGAVTLDLDARALDGVVALIEKFAPQAADQLRRSADSLTPGDAARLARGRSGRGWQRRTPVRSSRSTAVPAPSASRCKATPAPPSDAFKIDNLAALGAAKVKLTGRMEADDGDALVELIGLDRLIVGRQAARPAGAVGERPARWRARGRRSARRRRVQHFGQRHGPRFGPTAQVPSERRARRSRSPMPISARRGRRRRVARAELLPTSLTARLALSEGTLRLTDLAGTVAGTSVGGRLAIGLRSSRSRSTATSSWGARAAGRDRLAIGMPAPSLARQSTLRARLRARTTRRSRALAVGAVRAGLARPAVDRSRSSPRASRSRPSSPRAMSGACCSSTIRSLALQAIEGDVAGGRMAGELIVPAAGRRPDCAQPRPARRRQRRRTASRRRMLSGRLTLDVTAEGGRLSPIALIGSLAGSGTFTLENGRAGAARSGGVRRRDPRGRSGPADRRDRCGTGWMRRLPAAS